MYCHVDLDKEDEHYHRTFWKDTDSKTIEMYRLQRVTYAIASSSYYSMRPLQVLEQETTDERLRWSM